MGWDHSPVIPVCGKIRNITLPDIHRPPYLNGGPENGSIVSLQNF